MKGLRISTHGCSFRALRSGLVKTNQFIRSLSPRLCQAVAIVLILGGSSAARAQSGATNRPARIGVYDSRAIAVAYAGSPFQEQKLRLMKTRLREAEQADQTNEVARIRSDGESWQGRLHAQAFGTRPVEDLLEEIADRLPQIKSDAGVTELVSKWDKERLRAHADSSRVDVTMRLVDAFHPTDKQRERAVEIQKKKPLKQKP